MMMKLMMVMIITMIMMVMIILMMIMKIFQHLLPVKSGCKKVVTAHSTCLSNVCIMIIIGNTAAKKCHTSAAIKIQLNHIVNHRDLAKK